jgi:hypothetical protein
MSEIADNYGLDAARLAARLAVRTHPDTGEPWLADDEVERLLAELGNDATDSES